MAYRISFGDLRLNQSARDHLEDCLNTNIISGGPKVTEFEIHPVIVKKYYGKYACTEKKYPTEEYPFTPIHMNWNDDKYSTGDVDKVFDQQRSYNENMTLINTSEKNAVIGSRAIMNNKLSFQGENLGTGNSKQDIINKWISGETPVIAADFPMDGSDVFVERKSDKVSPEFVQYTNMIPMEIQSLLGVSPYVMGEGGTVPRTSSEAQARASFGTAQIKNASYMMQSAVAAHAKKALIYAQIESPYNVNIKRGSKMLKINSLEYDEELGSIVVKNEMKFDDTLLTVSFRNSAFHKNRRIEEMLKDLIQYTQGSTQALMTQSLIRLQNVPELEDILSQVEMVSQLEQQLQGAQQQIAMLQKQGQQATAEVAKLQEDIAVQRNIGIAREKINREMNKLVATIRAKAEQVTANADKEQALKVQEISLLADQIMGEMERQTEEMELSAPDED